jgi:hypothetical protein
MSPCFQILDIKNHWREKSATVGVLSDKVSVPTTGEEQNIYRVNFRRIRV